MSTIDARNIRLLGGSGWRKREGPPRNRYGLLRRDHAAGAVNAKFRWAGLTRGHDVGSVAVDDIHHLSALGQGLAARFDDQLVESAVGGGGIDAWRDAGFEVNTVDNESMMKETHV